MCHTCGPSWEEEYISWLPLANSSTSKLIENALWPFFVVVYWVTAPWDTSLSCCVIFKRVWLSTEGKWVPFVFPHAFLNMANTKSFWREIMLSSVPSKWDSLRENKFPRIPGCEWACVCVASAGSAGIASCQAAAAASGLMVFLTKNPKPWEGGLGALAD